MTSPILRKLERKKQEYPEHLRRHNSHFDEMEKNMDDAFKTLLKMLHEKHSQVKKDLISKRSEQTSVLTKYSDQIAKDIEVINTDNGYIEKNCFSKEMSKENWVSIDTQVNELMAKYSNILNLNILDCILIPSQKFPSVCGKITSH